MVPFNVLVCASQPATWLELDGLKFSIHCSDTYVFLVFHVSVFGVHTEDPIFFGKWSSGKSHPGCIWLKIHEFMVKISRNQLKLTSITEHFDHCLESYFIDIWCQQPLLYLGGPQFYLGGPWNSREKKRENYTRCSGLASGTRLTRVKQMMPKNNEFLHVETHFRVKSFVFWYQSYWKNKNKKSYDIEVWIETQGNNEKFILTSPAPDPKNWSPRFDDPKTRGPRNTRVWKQPHWKANVQPN